MQVVSGIWFSRCNVEDAPDNELVEFFVEKLVESITPDGTYGVPIYVFISEDASFSCIPTASE